MLDSGRDLYEEYASSFDGVSCEIKIENAQIIGLELGVDKLSEISSDFYKENNVDSRTVDEGLGSSSDDIEQYYFALKYDDRAAGGNNFFKRNVGIYFSYLRGSSVDDEIFDTSSSISDVKLIDLYTGFYFPGLSFENEIIFRLGNSADPNVSNLGGTKSKKAVFVKNSMDSIGLAGKIEYQLAESGF